MQNRFEDLKQVSTQTSRVTGYKTQGRFFFFYKVKQTWLDTYWVKKVHSYVLQLKCTIRVPGLPRAAPSYSSFLTS